MADCLSSLKGMTSSGRSPPELGAAGGAVVAFHARGFLGVPGHPHFLGRGLLFIQVCLCLCLGRGGGGFFFLEKPLYLRYFVGFSAVVTFQFSAFPHKMQRCGTCRTLIRGNACCHGLPPRSNGCNGFGNGRRADNFPAGRALHGSWPGWVGVALFSIARICLGRPPRKRNLFPCFLQLFRTTPAHINVLADQETIVAHQALTYRAQHTRRSHTGHRLKQWTASSTARVKARCFSRSYSR